MSDEDTWYPPLEAIEPPSTADEGMECEPPCEDEEESKEKNYVQWEVEKDIFIPTGKKVFKTRLTPGFYEVHHSNQIGYYFQKMPVDTSHLLRFPDTVSDEVIGEIQNFWTKEEVFKRYRLPYKRGILLYGDPGSGKSCTVQMICNDVIERGGVVIKFVNPEYFMAGIRALREVQPKTPVVALMEDLDGIMENNSSSDVLNVLDGIEDVSRTVFLATTNYPEKLEARIINRPSRFDKRHEILPPNDEARSIYFNHLIKNGGNGDEISPEEIKQWVVDTEKMSFAHLKELFIAVMILGNTYKDSLKTLKDMKRLPDSYDNPDPEELMGFARSVVKASKKISGR